MDSKEMRGQFREATQDLVLLAGKGHEQSQVIGDEHLPFDDAAIARKALVRRRTNSGVV